MRLPTDEDDIPNYIKNSPPPTDDEIWDGITSRFEELHSTLYEVRLENKEQAVPAKIGNKFVDNGVYWRDDELGFDVRSWLQIPYDPTRDEFHFIEIWKVAKKLGERLAPKIANRQIDVEFMSEWGSFCEFASIVQYEYLNDRPNLQHQKGAASQSRHGQKKWLAHIYKYFLRDGDVRADTDGRVLNFLQTILDDKVFPDDRFDEGWYRKILNKDGDDFTSSFKSNKLSWPRMKNQLAMPVDDIPTAHPPDYHL